jgi:hypothetical protein
VLNLYRLRFVPRPVATIATAAAVFLFVALGDWQLERAAEKRALYDDFARAEPALPLPPASVAVPRYQRVTASGSYDSSHQFLLDNMSESGRAGMHVLTPLLLADGGAVVVAGAAVEIDETGFEFQIFDAAQQRFARGGSEAKFEGAVLDAQTEALQRFCQSGSFPVICYVIHRHVCRLFITYFIILINRHWFKPVSRLWQLASQENPQENYRFNF